MLVNIMKPKRLRVAQLRQIKAERQALSESGAKWMYVAEVPWYAYRWEARKNIFLWLVVTALLCKLTKPSLLQFIEPQVAKGPA